MRTCTPESRLDLTLDAPGNVIRVYGAGLWTLPQMQQHIRDLHYAFARCRRDHGRVRVIADFRASGAQSRRVLAQATACANEIYRSDDRLAIVAASEILRAQMRKVERCAVTGIFLDPALAEEWLLSQDVPSLPDDPELAWEVAC